MYNTERKQRFIAQRLITTTVKAGYWTACFNMTEPMEIELGKDLCDFTETEYIMLFKQASFNTENYAANTALKINVYVTWCLNHGYVIDGINHFATIYNQAVEQGINIRKARQFIDRSTLLSLVSNAAQINPMDGFILMATYEGIIKDNYEDLLKIKISDFFQKDGKHYLSLHSGKVIEVSAELVEYAEKTDKAVAMYSYNSKGVRVLPYESTPYIIRKIQSKKNKADTDRVAFISRAFIRALKVSNAEKQISRSNIIMSGRVYYVNCRCEELKITAKEYFERPEYQEEFNERFGVQFRQFQIESFYNKYSEYFVK